MLPDKLAKESYYLNKLTLFLQTDPAMVAQFKGLIELLQNINGSVDAFFSAFSEIVTNIVVDDAYFDRDTEYKYDDLLDKIAACLGLQRSFTVKYDSVTIGSIDALHNSHIEFTETNDSFQKFNLTNNQLRLLIYCTIMKNSFDGSRDSINKIYSVIKSKFNFKIYQITADDLLPAKCKVIFDTSSLDLSDAVFNQYIGMFFAGFMTLKSVGIKYTQLAYDVANILFWTDAPTAASASNQWDNGSWS